MLSLLRHGFISLRRTPSLAAAIVVTLGVALAATVTVFSFLNSFLLRPLPYGDAARLVVIYEHSLQGGRGAVSRVTAGNAADIMARAKSFSRLGLLGNESVTVHAGDTTEVDFVQRVTVEVFPMLGLRAAIGTVISRSNLETGGLRAAVLSDALWRRRFGADAAIVGRTIQLDDKNYQVVGVMPADFRIPTFDTDPQAWLAMLPTDLPRDDRLARSRHLWAELAPGRTMASAAAELEVLAAALRVEHPAENVDRGLTPVALRHDLVRTFGRQLVLLQGAVLLVLAVAAFNCLCLLVARAIQRRREFAVRLALGAARRHLLAQLFAESWWLAAPAAALGCLAAEFALPFGYALLPPGAALRSLPPPHVDAVVAAVAAVLVFVVSATFSAVALLQTRRLDLESELRAGGRSAGSAAGANLARGLASAQIAVALALLIGAALLGRSQQNLAAVDPGFALGEFDLFRVGLRGAAYGDPARRLVFYDRVMENLRALPGVSGVTAATSVTTQPPNGYQGFVQEGDGLQLTDTPKRGFQLSVAPNFFQVFDLRLVAGRFLDETDAAGRPTVTVINAALAAKYWPGQSPIGKRVRLEGPHAEWVEIVGVVSDVLGFGDRPEVVDGFYFSLAQRSPPGVGFMLRCRGVRPDERALQRAVGQVDPNILVFAHQSLAEQYALSAWQSRFVSELIAAFALIAVVLSLVGTYAVNSFFVARRLGEFGLRVALGATAQNILGLVLRQSLRVTLLGLAVGVVLAFAANRSLDALLYRIPALDVLVYLAAALALTLACVVAALLPARRAAKVDPLVSLRAE